MTGQREFFLIRLYDCEHVLQFTDHPPKRGDRIYCPQCSIYRRVREAPSEFRVRCRNCILSRPFGRNEHGAWSLAIKHKNKNQGHRVEIYDGHALVHTITPGDTLPTDALGDPPF